MPKQLLKTLEAFTHEWYDGGSAAIKSRKMPKKEKQDWQPNRAFKANHKKGKLTKANVDHSDHIKHKSMTKQTDEERVDLLNNNNNRITPKKHVQVRFIMKTTIKQQMCECEADGGNKTFKNYYNNCQLQQSTERDRLGGPYGGSDVCYCKGLAGSLADCLQIFKTAAADVTNETIILTKHNIYY